MALYKRYFILFISILLLAVPTTALAVNVGEPAPEFTLKTLDGTSVGLTDFKGQVVLVKLATTWCPTCKELSGEIEKAGSFLKENNVVVLEVFVQDSPEMVERALADKEYPMTFHALLDDGEAYKAYNVYLIPRLVVVDPEGVVTFDSAGQNVTAEKLQQLVTAALPPPAS
jgi:peroxiredoxin